MQDNLEAVGSDYWEWLMRTDPVQATYVGDHRYSNRVPDIRPQAIARQREELAALRARLDAVRGGLADGAAVSAEVLGNLIDQQIGERSHHFEQWNLDQLSGPQVWLQEMVNFQPVESPDQAKALAERYDAFGPLVEAYVANLRAGVESGRTATEVARERVCNQLTEALAIAPAESPLLPTLAACGGRPSSRDLILQSIERSVYPAFRMLFEYLETYRGRTEVGISALPGGRAAYEFRIARHTTTRMDAQTVHDLGLSLLGALHDEMRQVAQRVVGSPDLSLLRERLRGEASNFYASREAIIDDCQRLVERITGRLGTWFSRLPETPCVMRAIEEFRERDAVAAYYYPPPDDLKRPGIYYVNTYKPETRPRYNMPALTAHEAVPGHHLQIALAVEKRDLPVYRRFSDFTAYIEGWALYAERLAVEMGIYEDDAALFGMLTYQAWRATRLIVDTGLHALGWDRARAIRFFVDSVGLPEDEIANEVDRYIVWPGQALAYSVGMSEILRLRREAETELGDRFDIRQFHAVVLDEAALPLNTLEMVVRRYIAQNLPVRR